MHEERRSMRKTKRGDGEGKAEDLYEEAPHASRRTPLGR